jgi:hypothetical protein
LCCPISNSVSTGCGASSPGVVPVFVIGFLLE